MNIENKERIIKIDFYYIKNTINKLTNESWKEIYLEEFNRYENDDNELKKSTVAEIQTLFDNFRENMSEDDKTIQDDIDITNELHEYISSLVFEQSPEMVNMPSETNDEQNNQTSEIPDIAYNMHNNNHASDDIDAITSQNFNETSNEELDKDQKKFSGLPLPENLKKEDGKKVDSDNPINNQDINPNLNEITGKIETFIGNLVNRIEEKIKDINDKIVSVEVNVKQLAINNEALSGVVSKEISRNIEFNENKINEVMDGLSNKFDSIVSNSINENKLKTELDKRDKSIILACGISSLIMSIVALFLIANGINWYQDHARYEIIKNIITQLDTNDKITYESWFKKYDSSKSTKGGLNE